MATGAELHKKSIIKTKKEAPEWPLVLISLTQSELFVIVGSMYINFFINEHYLTI